MTIRLNGEERSVREGCVLQELIEELKASGTPIAVELNRRIIVRSDYSVTALREGDRLEIVTFVGGG